MQTAKIDLIIMQITLVPGSLAPASFCFDSLHCVGRHLGWAPFSNMVDKRNF